MKLIHGEREQILTFADLPNGTVFVDFVGDIAMKINGRAETVSAVILESHDKEENEACPFFHAYQPDARINRVLDKAELFLNDD